MDVPEEPGSLLALLAVFVVVGFLFLLGIAKRRLSEPQQTVVWVAFTALFFVLCGVLVRSYPRIQDGQSMRETPALIEASDAAGH